jgi:formate-dependent nitrite reductase membrane component NrfD
MIMMSMLALSLGWKIGIAITLGAIGGFAVAIFLILEIAKSIGKKWRGSWQGY